MGDNKLMPSRSYELFLQLNKIINEEIKDEDRAKGAIEVLEDFTYSMIKDRKG